MLVMQMVVFIVHCSQDMQQRFFGCFLTKLLDSWRSFRIENGKTERMRVVELKIMYLIRIIILLFDLIFFLSMQQYILIGAPASPLTMDEREQKKGHKATLNSGNSDEMKIPKVFFLIRSFFLLHSFYIPRGHTRAVGLHIDRHFSDKQFPSTVRFPLA